jgi:hypothetical protein
MSRYIPVVYTPGNNLSNFTSARLCGHRVVGVGLSNPCAQIRDTANTIVSTSSAFQEGFLSEKRLIFTDEEVAFICNEDARKETENRSPLMQKFERNSLGHLGHCLSQGEVGILGAQVVIQEYTRRNLTYDGDALNAVVGALNTFSDGAVPTYHIWGVPFGLPTRDVRLAYNPLEQPDENRPPVHDGSKNPNEVRIVTAWFHTSPCPRRAGFPSWSPLGWKGEVSTPWDGGGTRIPEDTVIEAWWENAHHQLHELVWNGLDLRDLSSTTQSQTLRVSACTVPFEREYIVRESDKESATGWYIRIHVDEDTDVFVQPKWDLSDDYQGNRSAGICVFLNQPYTRILLVLDDMGEWYERSGYVTNTNNKFTRDGNGDSPLNLWQDVCKFVSLSEIERQTTFLLR